MPDEPCPFEDNSILEIATTAFARALETIRVEADENAQLLVGGDDGKIVWRLPGGARVSEIAGKSLFDAMVTAKENGIDPLIQSDGRLTETGLAWLEQQRRNVAEAFANIHEEVARATKAPRAE